MFKVEVNKAVKVFSQLYVGIAVERKNDAGIPLAFAAPHEENAAGKKRRETVNSWLEHHQNRPKTGQNIKKLVDNVARTGFKITDDIRRVYYGGGNVVFRVEDPDGWEIEIQSGNLTALIQQAGIEKGGVIPGKCIWGRAGAYNVLLHESSEEFKTAILAAEGIKAPMMIPTNERHIGAVYRLRDGSFGRYLGKMWVVNGQGGRHDSYNRRSFQKAKIGAIEYLIHVYDRSCTFEMSDDEVQSAEFELVYIDGDASTGWSKPKIRCYKKAPLIETLDATSYLTPDEVNSLVDRADLGYAGSNPGTPVTAFFNKPTRVYYTSEPVSKAEMKNRLKSYAKHLDECAEHVVKQFMTVPCFFERNNNRQASNSLLLNDNGSLFMGVNNVMITDKNIIEANSYGRKGDYAIGVGITFTRNGGIQTYNIDNYYYRSRQIPPLHAVPQLNTCLYPNKAFDTFEDLAAELWALHTDGKLHVLRIRAD